ncbi:MAG: deoxyribonuclease IV [Lachnospiraceae bacterium]|nr:deoxyribonuclease IV [Lachnospiraceae bacterium]
MLLLGSHVGMSGSEMLLGSVKEALSYNANTFMVYTGAPQNTRRKDISELNIPAARACMEEHGMHNFIVHAPYIINLANTIKPETYELAVEFLEKEITRTAAMGSEVLVLHPGSHVDAGVEAGIAQIIKGLNSVLTADTPVLIALETMAGKGSEIGRSFEELKAIYDGCRYPEKLRVCFDTCHVHDAGYDIVHEYDRVMEEFDRILGLSQIAAFHINDSKNERGAHKDRHENFGKGAIGADALMQFIRDERFASVPKILETPYIKDAENPKKSYPPYKEEIAEIRATVTAPTSAD